MMGVCVVHGAEGRQGRFQSRHTCKEIGAVRATRRVEGDRRGSKAVCRAKYRKKLGGVRNSVPIEQSKNQEF